MTATWSLQLLQQHQSLDVDSTAQIFQRNTDTSSLFILLLNSTIIKLTLDRNIHASIITHWQASTNHWQTTLTENMNREHDQQVRQQDAYPANARGQLRLCATPCPLFKGNISIADSKFYLAYSNLLKLTGASNTGGVWKNCDSQWIFGRSLLDHHVWTDHHLHSPL